MSELKPCPFCGDKAEIGAQFYLSGPHGKNYYQYGASCNTFACIAGKAFCTHLHREDAIAAWNTRTTDTELTRLKRKVEVLREGFSKIADENNDDCVHCIANEAIAAADRIAKEQPHDKD